MFTRFKRWPSRFKFSLTFQVPFVVGLQLLLMGLPVVEKGLIAWFAPSQFEPLSVTLLAGLMVSTLSIVSLIMLLFTEKKSLLRLQTFYAALCTGWGLLLSSYSVVWLFIWVSYFKLHQLVYFTSFVNQGYLAYYYFFISVMVIMLLLTLIFCQQHQHSDEAATCRFLQGIIVVAPMIFAGVPAALNLAAVMASAFSPATFLTLTVYAHMTLLSVLTSAGLLSVLFYRGDSTLTSKPKIWRVVKPTGIFFLMTFLIVTLTRLGQLVLGIESGVWSKLTPTILLLVFQPLWPAAVGLLSGAVIALRLYAWRKARWMAHDYQQKNTSGEFGTAMFASAQELEKANFYQPESGIISGQDKAGRYLFLPLANKLILSPQGGGKTVSSSIPALLSHNGPVFVFDVKGELWATTARFREQHLKRHVVTLDPFNLRKNAGFDENKTPSLLQHYAINPFDWLPQKQAELDRIITSFAASLILEEKGNHAIHFDENAKILIRGYIDYIVRGMPKAARSLSRLHALISEELLAAQLTFEEMSKLGGRAAAAANQVMRVGQDERGSILSTTYRQLDWISDSNIQATLSHSNVDLRDFLKGNMDIYILLPEDQTSEHNRLVRMVLSLLLNIIVQASTHELPKEKMLFLLDELAQLGYCPDVEKAIEVMRARGIVVWSVFQTLSQIEQFKKPDLFKSAKIKQIFTNDDVPTMEWIQKLGGKKTILTKSASTNKGDSRQKMQWVGGSTSKGEGESIHETGTDLIQLNQIRELAPEWQWLFVQGMPPIQCKKVPYYLYPPFHGLFDKNPLENPDKIEIDENKKETDVCPAMA